MCSFVLIRGMSGLGGFLWISICNYKYFKQKLLVLEAYLGRPQIKVVGLVLQTNGSVVGGLPLFVL